MNKNSEKRVRCEKLLTREEDIIIDTLKFRLASISCNVNPTFAVVI